MGLAGEKRPGRCFRVKSKAGTNDLSVLAKVFRIIVVCGGITRVRIASSSLFCQRFTPPPHSSCQNMGSGAEPRVTEGDEHLRTQMSNRTTR